jgi:hypothetical protein
MFNAAGAARCGRAEARCNHVVDRPWSRRLVWSKDEAAFGRFRMRKGLAIAALAALAASMDVPAASASVTDAVTSLDIQSVDIVERSKKRRLRTCP